MAYNSYDCPSKLRCLIPSISMPLLANPARLKAGAGACVALASPYGPLNCTELNMYHPSQGDEAPFGSITKSTSLKFVEALLILRMASDVFC